MIAGQAGVNEINRVEEKIKVKRAFIQFLQTDIEMLIETETDLETKAALKKLAEKVRFSDPMSHEMLGELESRISAKVDEMKTASDKKTFVAEIELRFLVLELETAHLLLVYLLVLSLGELAFATLNSLVYFKHEKR